MKLPVEQTGDFFLEPPESQYDAVLFQVSNKIMRL